MLKSLSTESAEPRKSRVGVSDNSKTGRDGRCKLDRSGICNNEVDEKVDNEVRKKDQKISKSKNLFKSKKLSRSKKMIRSDVFTPGARLAFTELRQAFVKVPILLLFDPERYIWVETDISSYAIGGVLNQQTLDNLG